MSERFDLVIVGGGFAGLVCARAAAERGLRVAVLERKAEPGAAVHTTGILVKKAAALCPVPDGLTREVRGVRLYGPALKHIDLDSPGYYFLATDTPALLRWLAGEAEAAGARLYFGCGFAGARRDEAGFQLDPPGIGARYLIGADGARSAVAEHFGLGRNTSWLVGVEAEYEGLSGVDGDRLHCFLDSRIAPGYIAWAVPGVGVTQVGLACRRRDRPSLQQLTEKLSTLFDFSGARIVERRSGPIPVGGLVRPFAGERVLLVGDAAGLVSPLTAGGIYPAIRFGRRAAAAVADHLGNSGPDPARVLAAQVPRYRWKSWLRCGLGLGPPNWMFDAALGLPPMRAFARLVYFHRKGLKSAAAWRDLLGRGA
jgi:flavin-dependent dehydrogenase